MPNKKERHRAKLRRRAERGIQAPPTIRRGIPDDIPGLARYECPSCGLRFAMESGFMLGGLTIKNETTGEFIELEDPAGWQAWAQCPRCGARAGATNQKTVVDEDGTSVFGFVNTPGDEHALRDAIDELRDLEANASLDEIVEVLEQHGPRMQPVVDYLRAHHLELAALGISLAALVVSLLTWLMPTEQDPPAPPDGITREQMERLIVEFQRESRDERPGERQAREGDHDQRETDHAAPTVADVDPGDRADRDAKDR